MRQHGSRLHLALEPGQSDWVTDQLLPDQLDGAGSLEKLMLGQPHLPHPPGAEPVLQSVLAQLAGFERLPAQLRNLVRSVHRHRPAQTRPDAHLQENVLKLAQGALPESDSRRDGNWTDGDAPANQGTPSPGVGYEEAVKDQEYAPSQ